MNMIRCYQRNRIPLTRASRTVVNFSTLNLSVKFADSSVVNSIAIVDTGVHDDVKDDRAHLSYGDLQLLSSRLAAHIAASALVRDPATVKSRKIAAFTKSNTSFVVSMLAAWRLNAVFVPLSAAHSEQEISYIVRDSGASVVCGSAISGLHNFDVTKHEDILAIETNDIIMSYLKNSSERQQVRDNASAGGLIVDTSHDHPSAEDEGSLVIYTSGTTGLPKGVLHTHRSLHAMVTALVTAWEYSPRDRILHFLPLHHVHGLVNKLLCVLYTGGTVEFLPSAAPAVIWDRLRKEELLHMAHIGTQNDASTPRAMGTAMQSAESFKPLTLLMGVPTVYARLLEHANTVTAASDDDDPDMLLAVSALSRFRLMVCGSAALPDSVLNGWMRLTGYFLLERYGMTEIGMALSNPYRGVRRAGHVGQPLPQVHCRLVDDATGLEIQSPGVAGELRIKGPNVFAEYLNKQTATEESFDSAGWFRTGDVAERSADGDYKLLGRSSSDIIKSAGYKISALEIERELLSHPQILEAAVTSVPDDVFGELVIAVVALRTLSCKASSRADGSELLPAAVDLHSLKDSQDILLLQAMRQFLADKLAPYKQPRRYAVVPSIPRNALGKVNKKTLLKDLNLVSAM